MIDHLSQLTAYIGVDEKSGDARALTIIERLRAVLPDLDDDRIGRMFPFTPAVLIRVGSQSHGTYIPKDDPDSIDDVDLMGVYVAPIEAYFGFGRQETVERKFGEFGAYDCVSYDIRHFVSLLVKSNPNVLGMLWTKPEHVLMRSSVYDALVANRKLFSTQEAYRSFAGYAKAQLHRMTHFDGPARKKMRLTEEELQRRAIPLNLTPEELLATRPDLHGERGSWKPGETGERPYIDILGGTLLMNYRQMCNKFTSGYQGKKRRELVEKFGYDVKNASHLIRLLYMAIEFLVQGELFVDRTDRDAEELKAIKRGEWPLERVQKKAEFLFESARVAAEHCELPKKPDLDAIEYLLVGIMKDWFRESIVRWDGGRIR